MISLVQVTRENRQHYLEEILKIENVSFPTPWNLKAFQQELDNPISHLWALMENCALVGYVCFWHIENVIQILNIAIHPDKRGQGNGYRLLQKVVRTGRTKGIDFIWLEVRESNLPARSLYQNFGFKEVGIRPRYYRDTNEDAVTMTLTLESKDGNSRPTP